MKKYGQSIIEYLLITVLVILGIVLMGAYVLRSTNAHFKLWDEGVQDSFQENLIQANQNNVPFISTNCVCTNSTGSCGLSTATSQCDGDEKGYIHSCLPNAGCDGEPASYCVYDPSCCKIYYKQSCGTNILPAPTYYSTITGNLATNGITNGLTCKEYYTHTPSSCTTDSDCPTAGTTCTSPGGVGTKRCYYSSCYYGEHVWATQCSTLPVACCPDSSCDPTCTGINPTKGSSCYCYDSTGDANGNPTSCNTGPPTGTLPPLNQSYAISYVGNLHQCALGVNPCQMVCNTAAGYFPVKAANGTITGCIIDFTVAAILNGQYSQYACATETDGVWTPNPGACCDPVSGDCNARANPSNPQWNCSSNQYYGRYAVTTNDCSFSICAPSGVIIKTVTATPTSPSSYHCACCNDDDAGNCVSCSDAEALSPSCTQQGSYPSCPNGSWPVCSAGTWVKCGALPATPSCTAGGILSCVLVQATPLTQCNVTFTTAT